MIGDAHGLVLWESDIDRLEIDKCYRLENVAVRIYNDVRYLSLSQRAPIGDIGEISEIQFEQDYSMVSRRELKGEIVGVISTDEYLSCVGCKSTTNDMVSVCGAI